MPITGITYTEGNSQAKISIKDKTSGFNIEFEHVDNPEFIAHVGRLMDQFIWTDKTFDECFKIDTFEKQK